MITVKYVDTIAELKGFTIYDGDFHIMINACLSDAEKVQIYLKELYNIESGRYQEKLDSVKELVV